MKPLFVVRCQIMALMLDFIWKTHTRVHHSSVCVFTLLKKNYENFESSE